ncbi:recombinase family protein [Hamadaea tsunoensis]|uniref:recombinase family protein n=1 Tax=Hamadaea tsunoensis TaxID=53368 RepID=UPI0006840EE5|nr:recombinase family protein [Hamadaea tsunoensis]
MTTPHDPLHADRLQVWAQLDDPKTAWRLRHPVGVGIATTRFAFYGRMSTDRFQHFQSSAGWQRFVVDDLIAGHGTIVVEYIDQGVTRSRGWARRPEAAKLLTALADPNREFDAVVVGEFERAFCGNQIEQLGPIFESHHVQLWLPELGGPVDLHNPEHQSLLKLLGVHAKREVQRTRFRVKAAMQSQVLEQGRMIGGRPPYGYMIVDAGPHPNKAHAQWGRRLHRYGPDPETARWVSWMFAQRLAGWSVAAITVSLNEQNVACPSAHDPQRNPHRSGEGWTLRTVASILANPRYTGRQVWNRQHTDHGSLDQADDALGHAEMYRWSRVQEWTISKDTVHEPLVSEADFIAAQAIHSTAHNDAHEFTMTGLFSCEPCGRRLEPHWSHGRASHRCRHGRTSSRLRWSRPSKNIYAREDQAILFLAGGDITIADLPTILEGHRLIIWCDHAEWRLDIDGETVFQQTPPRMTPIPKQRTPRSTESASPEDRVTPMEAVGK